MDTTQISEIVELAGSGVKAAGNAVGIVEQIKGLFRSASPEDEKAKQLVSELMNELYEARLSNLDVSNKLLELQLRIGKEDEYAETRALYSPKKLSQGGRVLALMDEHSERDDLFDLICPNCCEQKREFHPLQGGAEHFVLKCNSCRSEFENFYSSDVDYL